MGSQARRRTRSRAQVGDNPRRAAGHRIGKPYKLGLRADAARTAIEEALAGTVGVHVVDAGVDDGSIVVTVTVDSGVGADAIADTLGRYALTCHIKERR
jgi:fatty-acyl-CoA synthase